MFVPCNPTNSIPSYETCTHNKQYNSIYYLPLQSSRQSNGNIKWPGRPCRAWETVQEMNSKYEGNKWKGE